MSVPRISFQEARAFARSLGLKSQNEWLAYNKGLRPELPARPQGLCRQPANYYRAEWTGYPDWLGYAKHASGRRYHVRMPFEEARAFARSLGLKTLREWKRYWRGLMPSLPARPENLCAAPWHFYAREWRGVADWLGCPEGRSRPRGEAWMPFEAARSFAQSLHLQSRREWGEYFAGKRPDLPARPSNLPKTPNHVYRGQWSGFRDWLGVEGWARALRREWPPFEEARAVVRKLGLKSFREWLEWANNERPDLGERPAHIPFAPHKTYASQWLNWSDWLGAPIEIRCRTWRPYADARRFARALGLRSETEWIRYCEGKRADLAPRPADIPVGPAGVYGFRWRGWGEWLGATYKQSAFLPFEAAAKYARGLGLRTCVEWYAFVKRRDSLMPANIPKTPAIFYKAQWKGWDFWLGRDVCMPFAAAREFARALGLNSAEEWHEFCRGKLRGARKRPPGLPARPEYVYGAQFKGFDDWLGIGIRERVPSVKTA